MHILPKPSLASPRPSQHAHATGHPAELRTWSASCGNALTLGMSSNALSATAPSQPAPASGPAAPRRALSLETGSGRCQRQRQQIAEQRRRYGSGSRQPHRPAQLSTGPTGQDGLRVRGPGHLPETSEHMRAKGAHRSTGPNSDGRKTSEGTSPNLPGTPMRPARDIGTAAHCTGEKCAGERSVPGT